MANDGPLTQKLEKAVPQNEVTLAILRESALTLLINGNTESTFQSTAQKTERGLEVNTTNNRNSTTSKLIVDGNATYSPPGFNSGGFHLDTSWVGDYNVTHIDGSRRWTERDRFSYKGGIWDDIMSRTDKANVTITRMNAEGQPFQTYIPALSEMVMKDGRLVYDPNNQPVRIAKPAGSANNCGLDYANASGGNMDCNYIIRDTRGNNLGDLSYNETHKKHARSYEYRSVVRDMQGNVRGIVVQDYTLDANGDLATVTTSARPPQRPK